MHKPYHCRFSRDGLQAPVGSILALNMFGTGTPPALVGTALGFLHSTPTSGCRIGAHHDRMTHAANADSFLSRFRGYRPLGRSEAPLAPSPASAGFSFGTDCLSATCLPEQTPLPPCRLFIPMTPPAPAGSFFVPAVSLFQAMLSRCDSRPAKPRTASPQQAFSNNSQMPWEQEYVR